MVFSPATSMRCLQALVWSKDEVGFEDCHEDGTVGDEQADTRDDEEGDQGEEEAVLEGESHDH